MTERDPSRLFRTAEGLRLDEARRHQAHWKRWGPYLSERQWGTVREDYSPGGTAWEYLPHDHARSRAYRWGEDGLAGICDRHQQICFALALWNERDPILKERLFGLTGNEGNHGEDVKEYYFYLDSTPTHSYMRWLYKYPQAAYPYADLVDENRRRGRGSDEYELIDTGVFEGDRYFDVVVEYAKAAPEEILVRITATNHGPEAASLHILPTIWFRNTWAWGDAPRKPRLERGAVDAHSATINVDHHQYGRRWLVCEGRPELLFTENETNAHRLWGSDAGSVFAKDGINDYVVSGAHGAVNPAMVGTKAAASYGVTIPAGGRVVVRLAFQDTPPEPSRFGPEFEGTFRKRALEADEFFASVAPPGISDDARLVQRQALAGMLWSKQFYHYDVRRWLAGDPGQPAPPRGREGGRNREWSHLYNADVISMPDKWEYPWYAAWDLAFHCVSLAVVDPDFSKEQLVLLLREWYMHPNGQLPAYEWAFGDVNPPVHAWAAWRVYKIDRNLRGVADRHFLERVFQKLLLNFTWWVNRKDAEGRNVFQGGFLGLDNIGVFDRSKELPTGGHLEQSDGTSWMGMYCLNMLVMALELAKENDAYEDVASKFFEHFVYIAHAMNDRGGEGIELWDEEDGFYYDVLHLPGGEHHFLKIRSMVGLIPLFAVESLEPEMIENCPGFRRRLRWFIDNRPELANHVDMSQTNDMGQKRILLSLVNRGQLSRVLRYMLDEEEFLSPHGIRSVSRWHRDHPYLLDVNGTVHRVDYEPAESRSGLFGGNSNWRGPIWFPVNYLLIESLQKFHHYFGESLTAPFPFGSGRELPLWDVAAELSRRLTRLFIQDPVRRRPVLGDVEKFQSDPRWRDHIPFHEFFHGDTGKGLGASHQTGWTGLVAKLIQQSGE